VEIKIMPQIRTNYKIVLIGIDGADWRVIDPLIEKRKLPNFKMLKNKGSHGFLKTIKTQTLLSITDST
jgi:predicted AlkP superfamily phosphohydrolase/phosphomutase